MPKKGKKKSKNQEQTNFPVGFNPNASKRHEQKVVSVGNDGSTQVSAAGASCSSTGMDPPASRSGTSEGQDAAAIPTSTSYSGDFSSKKDKPESSFGTVVHRDVNLDKLGMDLKYKLAVNPSLPRKRVGGLGRPIKLISNCFPLHVPSGNVYHYDVEIYFMGQSTTTVTDKIAPQDKKFRCKLTKRNREVVQQMMKDNENFKSVIVAYDGRKNMYARNRLKFIKEQFTCKVCVPEENFARSANNEGRTTEGFYVSIKPVKKKETADCVISLDSLHALYQGQIVDVSYEAIMAIETILRQTPCLRYYPVGNSFFYPSNNQHLSKVKQILFGYHQSMRLGQGHPMLNLDIAGSVFYQAGPLINFVKGFLKRQSITKLDETDKDELDDELKNLQIIVTHVKGQKRRYRIAGLCGSASTLDFPREGKGGKTRQTVADYFAEKYKIVLKYPWLPCVRVNPKEKNMFFPMEVCEITAGQRCKGQLEDELAAEMIQQMAIPPEKRFDEIWNIFMKAKYDKDMYAKEFGISVEEKFVKLVGRRLMAPTVKYRKMSDVKPENGSWNMRGREFFEGAKINSWAIVSFTGGGLKVGLREFANNLFKIAKVQGINLDAPKPPHELPFTLDINKIRAALQNVGAKLIVVIMPTKYTKRSKEGKNSNTVQTFYRTVKRIGLEEKITTQCVQAKNVSTDPSVLSNICLKINTKMGGINNSLRPGEIPNFKSDEVLLVGADVTHPSPTKDIQCSIAAVVGSINPEFSQYSVSIQTQINESNQKVTKEVIKDLSIMMQNVLKSYIDRNGRKPNKIIFYRDGVSEGEFAEVRDVEYKSIGEACRSFHPTYRPKITYIVVQKRHHVRMMPEDSRDGVGKMRNPPPGTVADSTIAHPLNFDFYLYSQFGLLGTARPAYYTVVQDDNNFSADFIQSLTYDLCHLYSRCTKSISSPAPVRYADQAAFMARQILIARQPPDAGQRKKEQDKKLTPSELAAITRSLKDLSFKDIL